MKHLNFIDAPSFKQHQIARSWIMINFFLIMSSFCAAVYFSLQKYFEISTINEEISLIVHQVKQCKKEEKSNDVNNQAIIAKKVEFLQGIQQGQTKLCQIFNDIRKSIGPHMRLQSCFLNATTIEIKFFCTSAAHVGITFEHIKKVIPKLRLATLEPCHHDAMFQFLATARGAREYI